MTGHSRYDDISFRPLLQEVRSLSWQGMWKDLGAGLTVALLTVPQVMAYALIAGLPLTCGLFGALFATALAGYSVHRGTWLWVQLMRLLSWYRRVQQRFCIPTTVV